MTDANMTDAERLARMMHAESNKWSDLNPQPGYGPTVGWEEKYEPYRKRLLAVAEALLAAGVTLPREPKGGEGAD